ncbi:MAG: hypothetical protein LKCHEGNO_03201 [Burkholderiaceae bacterium]|jgi:putative membrane protein|nr:hypothetical protein [Burkholderiaceae bacterium]
MNSWTFLYPLLKSGHILAMAAWVGGTIAVVMLVAPGGRLPTMEAQSAALRVMRFVVNPALFITLALGTAVASITGRALMADASWLHVKLLLVLALCAVHGMLVKRIKDLRRGANVAPAQSANYLVFALLLPAVVIGLAVFKPSF